MPAAPDDFSVLIHAPNAAPVAITRTMSEFEMLYEFLVQQYSNQAASGATVPELALEKVFDDLGQVSLPRLASRLEKFLNEVLADAVLSHDSYVVAFTEPDELDALHGGDVHETKVTSAPVAGPMVLHDAGSMHAPAPQHLAPHTPLTNTASSFVQLAQHVHFDPINATAGAPDHAHTYGYHAGAAGAPMGGAIVPLSHVRGGVAGWGGRTPTLNSPRAHHSENGDAASEASVAGLVSVYMDRIASKDKHIAQLTLRLSQLEHGLAAPHQPHPHQSPDTTPPHMHLHGDQAPSVPEGGGEAKFTSRSPSLGILAGLEGMGASANVASSGTPPPQTQTQTHGTHSAPDTAPVHGGVYASGRSNHGWQREMQQQMEQLREELQRDSKERAQMLNAAFARARSLEDENKQLKREAATHQRLSSMHGSLQGDVVAAGLPEHHSTTPSNAPPGMQGTAHGASLHVLNKGSPALHASMHGSMEQHAQVATSEMAHHIDMLTNELRDERQLLALQRKEREMLENNLCESKMMVDSLTEELSHLKDLAAQHAQAAVQLAHVRVELEESQHGRQKSELRLAEVEAELKTALLDRANVRSQERQASLEREHTQMQHDSVLASASNLQQGHEHMRHELALALRDKARAEAALQSAMEEACSLLAFARAVHGVGALMLATCLVGILPGVPWLSGVVRGFAREECLPR